MSQQTVDTIIKQWHKEMPDLEVLTTEIIARMIRITKQLDFEISAFHKQYGLKRGEFDVIATLRRAGKPYKLTPTELINSLLLTSGAMTNRLDRLEIKGLIKRTHSQSDRRSVIVQLTEQGADLIDEMVDENIEIQKQLVSTIEDKEQFNQILKNWKI